VNDNTPVLASVVVPRELLMLRPGVVTVRFSRAWFPFMMPLVWSTIELPPPPPVAPSWMSVSVTVEGNPPLLITMSYSPATEKKRNEPSVFAVNGFVSGELPDLFENNALAGVVLPVMNTVTEQDGNDPMTPVPRAVIPPPPMG